MKTAAKILAAVICSAAVLSIAAAVRNCTKYNAMFFGPGVPESVFIATDDTYSVDDQIAEKALDNRYLEYFPGRALAEMVVFDCVRKNAGEVSACVLVDAEEFVNLQKRLYSMSGITAEAVITYTLPDKRLTEIEFSEDGAGREKWVREHFTGKALRARKEYISGSGDIKGDIREKLWSKAEKTLGCPVETEEQLNVDMDKGTWEIVKTIRIGDAAGTGRFEPWVLDKGTLTKKD